MTAGPAKLEKLSQGQIGSRTVHRNSPGGETALNPLTDKSSEYPPTQTQQRTSHEHPCPPLPFQLQQHKGLGYWGALGCMFTGSWLRPTPWPS